MGMFGKGTIIRDLTGVRFCDGTVLWKDDEYKLIECRSDKSYTAVCVKDADKKNLGMKIQLFVHDFPKRFVIVKVGTDPFPPMEKSPDEIFQPPSITWRDRLRSHLKRLCGDTTIREPKTKPNQYY